MFLFIFPPCFGAGAFDDTLRQRQPHVAPGERRKGNNRTIETTAIINNQNNNSFFPSGPESTAGVY